MTNLLYIETRIKRCHAKTKQVPYDAPSFCVKKIIRQFIKKHDLPRKPLKMQYFVSFKSSKMCVFKNVSIQYWHGEQRCLQHLLRPCESDRRFNMGKQMRAVLSPKLTVTSIMSYNVLMATSYTVQSHTRCTPRESEEGITLYTYFIL